MSVFVPKRREWDVEEAFVCFLRPEDFWRGRRKVVGMIESQEKLDGIEGILDPNLTDEAR
jgi:hypothetical protein